MSTINFLVSSFKNSGLESTNIRLDANAPVASLFDTISERLPGSLDAEALVLTTVGGRRIDRVHQPLSQLGNDFVSVRLHAAMLGGKEADAARCQFVSRATGIARPENASSPPEGGASGGGGGGDPGPDTSGDGGGADSE